MKNKKKKKMQREVSDLTGSERCRGESNSPSDVVASSISCVSCRTQNCKPDRVYYVPPADRGFPVAQHKMHLQVADLG